ncbi:MAG: Do family serine endopeptidase, partial [Myxococcota bacterium]
MAKPQPAIDGEVSFTMNLQVQRSNTALPSLSKRAGRFFVPSLLVTAAALAAPSPAQADIPFNPNIVADVAERVTPAVVNITTVSNRRSPRVRGFQDLFGPRGRRGPQRRMGAGSGVVISASGDIVTNNHVIEGADEIKVTFSNKEEYTAKLVGADKASDLAFLKIDAKDLPYLKFGSSKSLRLGEFVLAIGNPFGVGQTVTMGIVSAKGRANMNIVDYEDFIQTDASINPGNSGGALVNLRGELVGINTAILSRSGGAQGIGFAVPTSMVQPIREQIAKYGRVRRGWLGVSIQDLTPSVAKAFNLQKIDGVLVSDILADGPAAKSDLNAGDVIVAVNDRPTANSAQLRNRIALTRPGSRAKLDVVRDGKSKSVYVTLDEKEDDGVLAATEREGGDLLAGVRV